MESNDRCRRSSLAEKTGCATLLCAALVAWFAPGLAIVPLSLFLLLCLVAPFFPGFAFFLPLKSHARRESRAVALTFDDGPSPSSTPIVLALLARYRLRATFFVIGERALAHPELIAAILAQGHSIGNHSWRHDSLLMLRSLGQLRRDIQTTQDVLSTAGVQPLVFRPPAGITSPRLKPVLADLDLECVTFSCRAFDGGNRRIRNLAKRVLRRLRPGDILLLHDVPPWQHAQKDAWEDELDRLFSALSRDWAVLPLDDFIGGPVMKTDPGKG